MTDQKKPGQAIVQKNDNFSVQWDQHANEIATVLPEKVSIDKFKRVVMTAVTQNPAMLDADRRSLFNSCIKCATDGLLPDGREAALVVYNTKKKVKHLGKDGRAVESEEWVPMVQYMPMVQGIRKRMRNTGEVLSAESHVVYAKDDFDFDLGDDPRITHRPAMLTDRGEPVGAYAIIKLRNGEIIREIMSVAEIERARRVSRAKDRGPWVDWWGEMARKTVLRRAAKSAPSSPDMERLLNRDEEAETIEEQPVAKIAPPRPSRKAIIDHRTTREDQTDGSGSSDDESKRLGEDMDDQYRNTMRGDGSRPVETVDADTGEVIDAGDTAPDKPTKETKEDAPIAAPETGEKSADDVVEHAGVKPTEWRGRLLAVLEKAVSLDRFKVILASNSHGLAKLQLANKGLYEDTMSKIGDIESAILNRGE